MSSSVDMCRFAQVKKLPSHSLNERCVVRVADNVRPVICQPPEGLYQREAATMPEFLVGVLAHALNMHFQHKTELPSEFQGKEPQLLYWGKDCVPCDQPSWLLAYELV